MSSCNYPQYCQMAVSFSTTSFLSFHLVQLDVTLEFGKTFFLLEFFLFYPLDNICYHLFFLLVLSPVKSKLRANILLMITDTF